MQCDFDFRFLSKFDFCLRDLYMVVCVFVEGGGGRD